ncbi:hypothetical protein C8R44DRAFT_981395 [Mycena epipterygia]|nr:hypothetical protein C8R44DRAFT_981395 [Mycena epipterygia]
MFFNYTPALLLALLLVHDSPNYIEAFRTTAAPPSVIDLSGKVAVPVGIVNSGVGGSAFTLFSASYLPMLVYPGLLDDDIAVWDRYMVSEDQYIFKNNGTGYWLSIEEDKVRTESRPQDFLSTEDHVAPTIFAVEAAGENEFVIKLPYADAVLEAVQYTGKQAYYRWVELRPASGSSYQRWRFM